MSDATSTEERFVTLETKLAYQEKLLSDLNDVLLERTRQIDKLESRVKQLEQLSREGGREFSGEESPPPHY